MDCRPLCDKPLIITLLICQLDPFLTIGTNISESCSKNTFMKMYLKMPSARWQPFYADVSVLLSGVPDYFGRNKISSGGDLSHYSSASLY